MTDTFTKSACPSCSKVLRVPLQLLGKTVRCPGCQTRFKVPGGATPKVTAPQNASAPQQPQKVAVAKPTTIPSPGKPVPPEPSSAAHAKPNAPVTVSLDLDWDPFAEPAPSSRTSTASLPTSDDSLFANLPEVATTPLQPTQFALPGTQAVASASKVQPGLSRDELMQSIQKQLGSPVSMRGASVGYRLGLGLLSVFMMAMPIAYALLVAGVALGLYHYTFQVFPTSFRHMPVRGRAAAFYLFLIITPIIAGLIVLVFMFKPIFFSIVGSRATRSRSLTRAGEPELFELVDRICDSIRAPRPDRIEVDSEVNASASYGVGLRGIFKRKLVLTIGVPLVAGLSTRQFAGVLAHEFGHFSQGAGMRAQLIIGAINLWFAKVVYQRDDIDEKLDEAIEDSETAFGFVLLFAKFCVYLVRGVLWCFMIAAHSVSSIFSRQMEFDADRYEIALVGPTVFAQTGRDLHLLGNAFGKSMMSVVTLLKQAIFIDDLPKLIQVCRSQMSSQEVRAVMESIEKGKTGLLDTHPCTRERIAAANKIETEGVFTLDTPARNLFRDFSSLSNSVTQDFYRNLIGRNVQAAEMKRVDDYIHMVVR